MYSLKLKLKGTFIQKSENVLNMAKREKEMGIVFFSITNKTIIEFDSLRQNYE